MATEHACACAGLSCCFTGVPAATGAPVGRVGAGLVGHGPRTAGAGCAPGVLGVGGAAGREPAHMSGLVAVSGGGLLAVGDATGDGRSSARRTDPALAMGDGVSAEAPHWLGSDPATGAADFTGVTLGRVKPSVWARA